MPRYYPNTRFTDCWASMGNITFYHRYGECYYRTKAQPVFPGTSQQLIQVSIHKRALEAWRNISHEEQIEWNALATKVKSKRPPYGTKSHISGYNLFVSAYHGFACIGDEKIPEPKPMPMFPTITLKYLNAVVSGTNILINFQVNPHLSKNYKLLSRIQLVKPGAGTNPGMMRNYLAVINEEGIATFSIPASQQGLESCTLHMRYFLIDSLSGYRTAHIRQSETITLRNS